MQKQKICVKTFSFKIYDERKMCVKNISNGINKYIDDGESDTIYIYSL